MKLLKKIRDEIKSHGLLPTAKKILVKIDFILRNFIRMKVGIGSDKRRLELSRNINSIFSGVVAYGPFKGLRLGDLSWCASTDIAARLLGLYEQEILESLSSLPHTHDVFIDLGAGGGYYGIGAVVSKKFAASYCYEIADVARKIIEHNARLNGVLDRVIIRGAVENGFHEALKMEGVDLSRCVLLCDIEGGEFSMFDETTLSAFRGSTIFIEIHDFLFFDGSARLQKLKRDASRYFRVTELTTGARDLSKFPELNKLNDTDRWLIVSEGRSQLMTWLRLDPIAK